MEIEYKDGVIIESYNPPINPMNSRDFWQNSTTRIRRERRGEFINELRETWRDGKHSMVQRGSSGKLIMEKYSVNGFFHRENGPSVYTKTAKTTEYRYYIHGRLSRIDGPARIKISPNGTYEYYYLDGKPFRHGLPNNRKIDPNGVIVEIAYTKFVDEFLLVDGLVEFYQPLEVLSNSNGPAWSILNKREEYWLDGVRHNLYGPAIKSRSGNEWKFRYYVNNNRLTLDEWKDVKPPEILRVIWALPQPIAEEIEIYYCQC